jgi:tripartite-type tricarboxylate transporter receptor subunit TctC
VVRHLRVARGTPAEIVRLLNEKIQAVIDEPATQQRLFDIGAEPIGGSVESFAARYRADYHMWGQFIRENRIKLE